MKSQNKTKNMVEIILSGVGVVVLYLLLGTVLDYVLTQILSQYFSPDCSEDCYFGYFNAIFIVVALLSVAGGVLTPVHTYKRSTEKQ